MPLGWRGAGGASHPSGSLLSLLLPPQDALWSTSFPYFVGSEVQLLAKS